MTLSIFIIPVSIGSVVMFINSSNKSNYHVLLGTYNGEQNNSRRTSFKEVTTEEKNITN